MLLIETALTHDSAALDAMITALPPSWQARITRKKPHFSRVQSAVAYTMLADILQTHYGISTLPAILADENGKPSFEQCPLYFSISHCQTAVAVIVEDHPVGLDVQDVFTKISPALAARIAAPHDPAAMTAVELTALWTQKEASAKLDGGGLSLGLATLPLPHHTLTTQTYDGFVVTVAE